MISGPTDKRQKRRRASFQEALLLCGFVSTIAAVALWGAADLPQPRWEPLGPGSLPNIIAYTLIALSIFAVAWSFFNHGFNAAGTNEEVEEEDQSGSDSGDMLYVGRTIAFLSLSVLGVIVMSVGISGYRPVAFIISVAGVTILNGFKLPPLIPTLIFAAAMSVGVHFAMTQLLAVPLR